MYSDSFDKVMRSYMAAVNAAPIRYAGTTFPVKPLVISPDIFRGYKCYPHCGGCCPRFSLTYLPDETRPYPMPPRTVTVNGRTVELFEDAQKDHTSHFCRNLTPEGMCSVHGRQPFSCDFELLRVTHFDDHAVLSTRLYGRGWNMLRIFDNERGALCTLTPPSHETRRDVARRLNRLQHWADHCGIRTRLAPVLRYVATGPHTECLNVPAA